MRIHVFDAQGQREIAVDDELDDLLAADDTVVWFDVQQPASDDLAAVQQRFGLHELSVEDALRHGQRPKLDPFGSHAFLVVYAYDRSVEDDTRTDHAVAADRIPALSRPFEIDVFLGSNWLITVHRHPVSGAFSVDEIMATAQGRETGPVTAAYLVYLMLDVIVDRYSVLAEALMQRVATIEDEIFEARDPELHVRVRQRNMHRLRADLTLLRRWVAPLAGVIAALGRGEVPWVDDRTRPYLRDVSDHVLRLVDQIDVDRTTMDNTVQAYMALVANHQNDIMKKMTSWGAILIVSTLIAGIYGMNFEFMPELRWALGYPMALGFMVLATVGLRTYFKRKDWLSPPE